MSAPQTTANSNTVGADKDQRVFLSPPHMSGREEELVQQAFASNFVAPAGPMLDLFEERLQTYTGFKHVAVLTSGTAAIHLALRLCGVGAGDRVWSPTLTFIGGVAPILYLGAEPVFVDCERCGLVDLDLAEEELSRANQCNQLPKAMITTDLYGNPCDNERAHELCKRYGVQLISDAAEAMGAKRGITHSGHPARFAAFSFNGNKIITTSGGGALASNDEAAIVEARKLATQAREAVAHYEHETYGYNYRLSNICASIGVGQLEVLDERVARKREIFKSYKAELSSLAGISFLEEPAGAHSNKWLTVMMIDRMKSDRVPADVITALEDHNIEARPVWKPMHMQPLFRDAECFGGAAAADLYDTGVCLPSGTAMSEETLNRIVSVTRSALA